ncbi:MAG TPA: hypothetical protein VHC44_14270 [Verrucomicrobiae bacterium]|nr:hypothetical protein [Verrucomicrobiae bacterium]
MRLLIVILFFPLALLGQSTNVYTGKQTKTAEQQSNVIVAGGGGGGDTPFISSVTGGVSVSPFDGIIGYQWVPPVNATITALGIKPISGNSGTHTVYFLDVNGTILASASVNLSGSTAGVDVFTTISSLSVVSGTPYYVMMSVASGGDNYLNDSSTVTFALSGVTQSSWNSATGSTPHIQTGGAKSMGTPTFKFH